jgi:hypothetical protein
MGKKNHKRSKQSSNRMNDEPTTTTATNTTTTPQHTANASAQQHPQPISSVYTQKVLNPFYIESNQEEEEEHVGLLDYDDVGGADAPSYWNDAADEYDINPYTRQQQQEHRSHRSDRPNNSSSNIHRQQQQHQLYFEWKIRIGLIVAVSILAIWLILTVLHDNNTSSSNDTSAAAAAAAAAANHKTKPDAVPTFLIPPVRAPTSTVVTTHYPSVSPSTMRTNKRSPSPTFLNQQEDLPSSSNNNKDDDDDDSTIPIVPSNSPNVYNDSNHKNGRNRKP